MVSELGSEHFGEVDRIINSPILCQVGRMTLAGTSADRRGSSQVAPDTEASPVQGGPTHWRG